MSRRALLAAILVALSLAGCSVGSRRVVRADRDVEDFDEVVFEGIGELTITQGSRESLSIEAESNIMRRITTQVRGGTLYIGMRSGGLLGGVVPTRAIKFDLTMRDIARLELLGAGGIYAGEIEADQLRLDVGGAGVVIIRSLSVGSLRVEHTGVGRIELSGDATTQRVTLAGAGDYDAGDFESADVELDLRGLGKATVWANESLDVVVAGAGSVSYYGDPDVSQDIGGLGSVRGLGRHE